MNSQKFVAWDKLPTVYHKADTEDSSSSSSKSGSIEEEPPETLEVTESTSDMTYIPIIEIPHSVRTVLNKIDTAQLDRAKKDISKKLHRIQEKVHRAYEHYKKVDGFDPDLERDYLRSATWEEKSRRSNLLDEINDALDQSAFKQKELQLVLESLKAWSEMMRIIELQEKMIVSEDWIEEAEKKLLKHFHAIQKNIQRLIKMCAPLLQMTEKARRKSAARVSLFQAWRVKVIENPQLAEPLKAEQMVEDEALTFAYTREINEMILELADLSFFNKEEVTAIKYIAAMVENLTRAFGLLSRQFRSLKVKLEVGAAESRKHEPQVTSLQRELRMIIEKKAALELQVQHAEERCKLLLTTNEAMQKELQSTYERGQMSKPSLSSPSSKVLQEKAKSQVDIQKDVSVTKSVKQFQPTASKVSSVESEAPSSSEEMGKLKHESEDYDTQKQISVDSTTQSQTSLARDSQSKKSLKETTSQIASQKLAEKTTPPGEKKRWEFPVEKVIQSIKTLKTEKQPTSPLDPKLATAKVVTESNLSQSSGAGVPGNIQELTSEGEPSPQSSTVSSPTSRITEDVKLPAEKPLPKSPGIQLDGKSERKLSLKHSAQKIVKDVKSQKRVKFLKGVSAQTALESSEMVGTEIPEGSPLQESLTGTAEDVEPESQDAQTGGFKEKTEMDPRSILVKRPTDISEREGEKEKQAKVMRDVIHHLGIKLQELAKEKGGVLEEDTIKELFDEVDMTPEEDISEQDISGHGRGSLTADMLARAPLVRRFELHASAIERSSKSREDPGEAVSKQDVKSALQEFQASILTCIEDKLEKLKKLPSDTLKEPEIPKPADPQVQDLYQEIDRKLDECFSAMKHKHRGAMIKRKSSSQRIGEKEIKLQSSLESPTIMSQESSVSSLSLPEEEGDRQTVSKARKLSKQHLEQVQTVLTDQEKQQRKREDVSKYIHPKEEKLLHLPEVVLCVQDKKSQEKELQQTESLLESESGLWLLRLQERMEWEKERLHEEQLRLQEERQRLQEEEQYLQHWHNLFENQQEQWSQQQLQQQDQECLWNGQLEHWQQVTQDHEEKQQHWWLNEEQHQQQLQQLQEELQTLQRQYEQQLLQQKEQTEDQRHWDELQVWREKQLQAWQEENTEQEKKRSQWRQQLADHEKFLETWQQEKAEREAQYNNWQEEMWQQQQAQESLWQRQSQQQQRRWQRQVQRHQIQERKRQAQQHKVQERQKQIWDEEEILAPKLKMLRTRVQGELAKEVQQQELREPLTIKLEPPTHKIQVPPTARMDYLLPATHKAGPLPTTPDLSPEPSDIYIDSFDLDITFSPKLFPRDDGFPAPSMTEQHYSLSVETQRKNLELLEEANQKVGLASDLYKKAKETITEVLNSNVERLALLFRKYIAFRRLQEIRQILTAQLDAAKDDKDGATVQKLYRVVERLDAHQEKVLNNWRTDQKTVEKKRQHNMENMIVLFAQLRKVYQLQLSTPCPPRIKAAGISAARISAAGISKEIHSLPHTGPVYLRHKVYQSPLFAMKKPVAFSAIVRDQGGEHIESLWQTDISELSVPVGPKTPVSLLWPEASGFPDIPRLLEFDITSLRNKPLQELKTREDPKTLRHTISTLHFILTTTLQCRLGRERETGSRSPSKLPRPSGNLKWVSQILV